MSKTIDKTENQDLLKKLSELGLGDKEARVYLALLPRPNTGTTNLIRATGLHGQFVYAALARLEGLGLTQHVIQGGRKKFSVNAPQRIVSLVDEKKLAAQAIVRELQNRFVGVSPQSFEIYQGAAALVGHELEMLRRVPQGSRIDVVTGLGEEYMTVLGHEADEFERIRLERKIEIRVISTEARRKTFEKMSKQRALWSYKTFPGLGTGAVDIGIWHDSIVYNVFGEQPLCFALTNKEIADGYREFFKALWSVSSE